MAKDVNKKLKSKTNQSRRQKGAIIGLSIALALAGGAAVAMPLILLKKGGDQGNVKTYIVTFNVGKGLDNQTQEVVEGKTATQPAIPITGGQQVNNWKKEDGSYWNFKTDKVTSNVTLTAEWTDVPPTSFHTVTFKVGEEIYATQAVKGGDKATEPKSPTPETGYQFAWWQELGKETAFNFNTPINADLILEAKFDAVTTITHKITYLADAGGTFAGGSTKEERSYQTEEGQAEPFFFQINKPTLTPSEGFVHIGWEDADGNDLNNVQITKDIEAHAKYMVEPKYSKLTLKPSVAWGGEVEIQGTDSYSWSEDKTFGSIKKGLSVAKCASTEENTFEFSHWSAEEQTEFGDITKTKPSPADDTPIGEGEGAISELYPQFIAKPALKTVELTVKPSDTQLIRSGSATIEVPYQLGIIEKKFSEITKPEVYEEGKVFEGYYTDEACTQPWDPETIITPELETKDIYVKTIVSDQRASVSFAIEDETGHDYTWVGNHTDIRCEAGTKLSDIAIPNVYKDAQPDPSASIGFKTNYVFKNWYYLNAAKEKKVIEDINTFTIDNSITLYADFEKKTEVKIEIDEESGVTSLFEDPSTKWDDVAKPEFTVTPKTPPRYLIGWQAQDSNGDWMQLAADSKISDIKLASAEGQDKVTTNIEPILSEDVHTITFSNEAKVVGETETKTVVFEGNTTSYVDSTKNIKINSTVNKPILPKASNTGITFDNKWEIKGGTAFEDWTEVTSSTEIPKGDKQTYEMRPIVTKNINVTYEPGEGTAVGETEISIGSSTAFSKIYKPTITPPKDKVFSHWAKDAEGKNKVLPGDKIEADTTLYAIYTDAKLTSEIWFMVSDYDLNDTSFPAQKINDTNCLKVVKSHYKDDELYVSDFVGSVGSVPTKKKHSFLTWGTLDDQGKPVALEDLTKTLVEPGKPLKLYAVFKPNATAYHKVTIAEDESKYSISGPTSFYVGDEEYMPINDISNDIELEKDDAGKVTSSTFAWTVGKVLTGWTDSEGNPITSETQVKGDLLGIKPVFGDPSPSQPLIKFLAELPGQSTGATIGDSAQRFIPINDKLSKYLKKEVEGWVPPSVNPAAKTTFDKWVILNADGTTSEITGDTRVTKDLLTNNTLTLVATYIDQSIFEGIDGAYFFDTEKQQWGAIQSYFDFSSNVMKVLYQNGKTDYVLKSTFNYEIKFGAQTTSIPDYFMYGCVNWNNGEQPLKLPSNIKSIGNNVMGGCSSFNQPIEAEITTEEFTSYGGHPAFTIGENFMKNCYLFDNDITIKYAGGQEIYFAIGEGFMCECQSLGKTATKSIDLSGWSSIAFKESMTGNVIFTDNPIYYYSCLSTLMPNPRLVKLRVSDGALASFTNALPNLTSATTSTPYRRSIEING